MIYLLLAAIGCVALDTYVSWKRINTYGRIAEINLLVRQLMSDFGTNVGLVALVMYNIAVLSVLAYFQLKMALALFTGMKAGLALMQLKSLQMESFVERVLAKARSRTQIKESK